MNFIEAQNIERFRRLLETEADPRKRAVVERLLAAEPAKIMATERQGLAKDVDRP